MRVTAKICEISNLKACQKYLDFSDDDVVIRSLSHLSETSSLQVRDVDDN